MNNTFVREISRFLLFIIGFLAVPYLVTLIMDTLPLTIMLAVVLLPLLYGVVGLIFSTIPKKAGIYFLLPQVFLASIFSELFFNLTPHFSLISVETGFILGIFGSVGALGGYFILWQRAQKEKQISTDPK